MSENTFANPYAAHRNVGIPLQGRVWEGERFVDQDWAGMTFQDCVFEHVVVASTLLQQTTFVECRFVDCVFDSCRLLAPKWTACTGTGIGVIGEGEVEEAVLSGCEFGQVDVAQAGRQVVLAESRIDELVFRDAGLTQDVLTLSDTHVGSLSANRALWRDGSFVRADLANWAVEGSTFVRCNFIEAHGDQVDLSGAVFDGCNLYRSQLADATFQRAERCLFAEAEVAAADFREARVSGSLFARARAQGTRFDGAVLDGAVFADADLTGASFAGASAPDSVWAAADLTNANLDRLAARGSSFRNARLAGASLSGADFRDTDLHGVEDDLSAADTRDSRGSVAWRAARERELQRRRGGG